MIINLHLSKYKGHDTFNVGTLESFGIECLLTGIKAMQKYIAIIPEVEHFTINYWNNNVSIYLKNGGIISLYLSEIYYINAEEESNEESL